MRLAFEDEQILAVLGAGPATAIEVTQELIDRGVVANRYAIGEVDRIRPRIKRLVREGKVRVLRTNASLVGNRQEVYALESVADGEKP